MSEQRQPYRVAIERAGHIRWLDQSGPCQVRDLTEHGFLLSTDLQVTLGDTIRLACDLDEHRAIECVLLLTYVRHPYAGGRIIKIAPHHQATLASFINAKST